MTVPLEYAQGVPLYKRKVFRRGMAALSILIVVSAAIFLLRHWIAAKWHRYWLLRAQSTCMTYVPDPGRILYTEEPATIAALVGSKNYMRIEFSISSPGPGIKYSYAVFHPEPWTRLMDEMASTSAVGGVRAPMSSASAIVYLHGVKAPSGEEFLACVEVSTHLEKELSFWHHTHALFAAQPASSEFIPMSGVSKLDTVSSSPLTKPLRLYAGTADTVDGMKFTVVYEVGGVQGHIRGQYRQDPVFAAKPGGLPNFPLLTMKIVDGPLKP